MMRPPSSFQFQFKFFYSSQLAYLQVFYLFLCCLFLFTSTLSSDIYDQDFPRVRAKRQSGLGGQSILTVEWEGIHSGLQDDSAVAGFLVEYRPEAERTWRQHDGIIPYKGPNYQYRVKIRDLPSGSIYYVRIKVVGRNNEILVKTPEIKAQSETVKFDCRGDVITQPRNVQVGTAGEHSISFLWEPPECGNVYEYEYELLGEDNYALFEFHRGVTTERSVIVRNLLPGTRYRFRIRALDGGKKKGDFTSQKIQTITEGRTPAVSSSINLIYKSDSEIRVEWDPVRDRRLQHYEVMVVEKTRSGEGIMQYRATVPSGVTSYVFKNLKPTTDYVVGVIAFVDNSPEQVYQLNARTGERTAEKWEITPTVEKRGLGQISVRWEDPSEYRNEDIKGFIIEFKMPNETTWRRYGEMVNYIPGKTTYNAVVRGLSDDIFYQIRVYMVNRQDEIIAMTEEFSVGQGADESCAGIAGVPHGVDAYYIGQTSITYRWNRPECDEAYGPIEGFEYLFWNLDRGTPPERPSYTPGTQVTLDRLTPDHRYAFRVRSRSRGGQSPWTEVLKATTKPDAQDDGNIYHLRIVLAPPKSFLVWTPLPEHQGRIRRFRLSYKVSTTEDWTRIEDNIQRFECPDGIGNPGDFCYDLTGLTYGVQYTSDLVYRLDTGEWSRHGNPLFFILVEAGAPKLPSAPINLHYKLIEPTVCHLSWLPPLSDVRIDGYKVQVRVIRSSHHSVGPGMTYSLRTSGRDYSQVIDNLYPDTLYNVSVRAESQGFYGPPTWLTFSTGAKKKLSIDRPQIEQRGNLVRVNWNVRGSLKKVCCYQIDLRNERQSSWEPYGREVSQVGNTRSHSQELSGLQGNTQYFIRIRGLNKDNRRDEAVSDPVSLTTQCQAPSSPPQNIQVTSQDSRTLFLQWTPPDRRTWGCGEVWYHVEGTMNGRKRKFRVESDPRGFRVEHRIPSEPGTDWKIRVQTANSGGESPWSQEFSHRTESEAYVSTPRLNARGSDIGVDWRSEGRGQGKVMGYRMEYRSSENPRWTPSGSTVPYRGDNMAYSGTISGVEIGDTYTVRIQVLDRGQQIIYTSPESAVRTSCSPPTQPPIDLRVTAPDPGHVKVTWIPPGIETWNCNEIHYEINVLEPESIRPVRLNSRQTTHVFNSGPNQRWSVQMRTGNSAGNSPWSRVLAARTPPPGELIIGPSVTYQRGAPQLTWRSISGVDDLVAGYRIEFNPESRPRWTRHSSGTIRYTGWQRPYVVAMGDLPEGDRVQARVIVMDHNNGIQYTSPAVSIQMPARCRPPQKAPDNLRISAMGSNRIRAMWKPLTRSQWNCDSLWYIVKYSTPTSQGFRNFTSSDSNGDFDSDPYTRWAFQIQSVNPSGSSPWSEESSGTTQQSIPGSIRNLRIVAVDSDSASAVWQEPNQPNGVISGYEVRYQLLSRGMCEELPEREVSAFSPIPSFSARNLHPHSRYRMTVAAKTSSVGQKMSTEFRTEGSVPTAPPRALRGQGVSSSRVSLSWQAPPCLETNGEIQEYEYELRGEDPWAKDERRKGSSKETRTNVDGLIPYTAYRVRVRAYTSKGPGPWSNDVIVKTKAGDRPLAPPMLRIVDTQARSVKIMWQSPHPPHGEIEGYKVRHSPGGTGQWREKEFRKSEVPCTSRDMSSQRVQIPAGATLHCALIGGLLPEYLYDFQVAARIGNRGYGPWSRTESARTSGGPVMVLSVDKTGGSETHLEISWNVRSSDQPRVIGFRIISSAADGNSRLQQYQVDGSTYQYRIEGLRANTLYNVTVQARTQSGYHDGKDAMLRTDDARVGSLTSSPRVIKTGATDLTVEWDEVRDGSALVGYAVEYKKSGTGAWSRNEPVTRHQPGRGKFQAVIGGLIPNTEYEIRVKPIGKNQRMGDPSPSTAARTRCAAPVAPPQGIRVSSSGPREVRVTWVRSGPSSWHCDEVGVEVWYKGEGQTARTQRVSSDETEFSIPSAPHTSWLIKLRNKNQAGQSPWSNEFRITTDQGAPGQVRNLRLVPESPNEVFVTWSEPLEKEGIIVGYDVSYRLKYRLACPDEKPRDASTKWVTVYNLKDLNYKLTGLLPFSEYEVKVQARTTVLGPEVTKTVSTRQTAPSAPPLDLKVVYTLERSLSFEWDAIECSQRHGHITNYEYELIGQDDWAKLERQIANTTETKVDITGLTPFTKYLMRVKGYNSAGGGPNTENLEVMTEKADAPLPPQDLVVMQEGTDFFVVSWLPPYPPWGPHDSFKVRYREFGRETWREHELRAEDRRLQCHGVEGLGSPRLCLNITGLEPGKTYSAQSTARIEGGTYGQWSEPATANTLEILPDACISIRLIKKTDSSLHVGWVPPSDPQGKIMEYQLLVEKVPKDPNAKKMSFRVEAPTTDYEIKNLEPDTFYNITVRAGTKRGFGPGISTRHSTEKFKIPRTDAPTLTPVGADEITVEWNGVSDPQNRVKGYILEFRPSEDPNWQEHREVIPHDSVKRRYMELLRGFNPDTTYLVRIKTVDNTNRVSQPSDESETRTGCDAPKSPPVNVRLSAPNPRQVRVAWQAPPVSTWQCSSISFRLKYRNGTLGSLEEVKLPSNVGEHIFSSQPFTKWTVQLRTENPVGNSEWTDEISLTTPEDAPGPVQNVRGVPEGPNSMRVTWEEPDEPNGEIKGYTLTYFLKSKGGCPTRAGSPEVKHVHSRNQVIRDLEPASTYEVIVTARTSKEGPPSKPILVTTEEDKPSGPPQRLVVNTVGQTTGVLGWNPPQCDDRNGEITGYEYETQAVDPWVLDKNKNGKTMTDRVELTNLIPYTQYKFRVRAVNQKGSGPFTPYIEFRTKSGAPPAPSDLIAEQAQPHAIEVSFLPPSPPHGEIDEYRIRHTIKDRVSWTEVRERGADLECPSGDENRLCYRVTPLESEENYAIQVAAHTKEGDWGDWSDTLEAKTTRAELPIPEKEMSLVDRRHNSMTVEWEGFGPDVKTKNLDGFVLEYSLGGQNSWIQHNDVIPLKMQSGSTYRETVRGLKPDTGYFFRLKVAHKSGENGLPGPVLKGKTLCGRPLDPPSNVKLESTNYNTVVVTWKNPSESSWQCGDISLVLKYENSTHSGYIDVDPKDEERKEFQTRPGTKWTVQMRTQAMEEDGVKKGHASEWSPEKSIITQGLPGSVFVDLNPIDHDKIQVTWDLPEEDGDWEYGVDVTYQLLQKGRCPRERGFRGTKYEVMDRRIMLDNLEPYSIYEVTVTPRTPSHLVSAGLQPPRVVQEIRTGELAPDGAPKNLRLDGRTRQSLAVRWENPDCEKERGEITQFEYELKGMDDWVKSFVQPGVTTRLFASEDGLESGTRYRFRVRAYTSAGHGPWSDHLDAKTSGSVLGPPRELHTVSNIADDVVVTWLPPYPLRGKVRMYKLKYNVHSGDEEPIELTLREGQLSCAGVRGNTVVEESLCHSLKLKPHTTYRMSVQGKSDGGDWGDWSRPHYLTTRPGGPAESGGSLKLVSAGADNLKVKWDPPGGVEGIKYFLVYINPALGRRTYTTPHNVSENTFTYHFRDLEAKTPYNVTVEGGVDGKIIWHVRERFKTTDVPSGLLSWLAAPSNLTLIRKTHTMMEVQWEPPEILLPRFREFITHYRVTIAPYDPGTSVTGAPTTYTVPVPGTRITFQDLEAETVYNITVQAGTRTGYGDVLWGDYSTLPPPGYPHILRLRYRTPKSLHVEWVDLWQHPGYITGYTLRVVPLHSLDPKFNPNAVKVIRLDRNASDHHITDLIESTIYNVTLTAEGKNEATWGAYNTLPPGWFLVKNLTACQESHYSISLRWNPIDHNGALRYQVRYATHDMEEWITLDEPEGKHKYDLRCPDDPCNSLCYLIFNLKEGSVPGLVVQVRAKVNGMWNRWKTAAKFPSTRPRGVKEKCCIVPPPFILDTIGKPRTTWNVKVKPAPDDTFVTRYFVIVDERDPPGPINHTMLTDKITAKKLGIPYYITGGKDKNTLTKEEDFTIGDGTVHGGYLNYPLEPGKKYNWAFYTKWMIDNKDPVHGLLRDNYDMVLGGWPWWWLLLLLLLLLLLILLCCCLLWCLCSRYRRRSEYRRVVVNGTRQPLLGEDKEKGEMAANLRNLEGRLDSLRNQLDTKVSGQGGKGDFEDGYVKGFRDANKIGSGTQARKEMDQYGTGASFQQGYSQGLRDAGLQGLTTSMKNLAARPTNDGYSSGYIHGFRDGNSGAYGDKISTGVLARLEEHPEEYKSGYIDGFKDAVKNRGDGAHSDRMAESLSQLTDRLATLEKTKGDEIHTTKVYHVYNQAAVGDAGYSAAGAQLAQELEESRRSTLRRHYTPGDYMKYGSDNEGGTSSLRRHRRTLSASALGREESPGPYSPTYTGTGRTRYTSGTSASRMSNDTFSRRYNYRSRSDMGRRTASQTILDGSRPGPTTPTWRREALETLQRELDTISRTPRAHGSSRTDLARGYASDTGYLNDSYSRGGTGRSTSSRRQEQAYDYDATYHSRSMRSSSSKRAAGGTTSAGYSSSGGGGAMLASGGSSHLSPVPVLRDPPKPPHRTTAQDDGMKESVNESYARSYREEYSAHPRNN